MKLASRIFRRNDWYVTSPFGWRTDPINGSKAKHNGTDYGTHRSKWPQYALENGIVESAGKDNNGGIFAWVKYPRLGIRLLHYHLDSVKVKTGQSVNKDTIIGYTGTTGRSTGIHLHLGMRYIGSLNYVDSYNYDYVEEVIPVPSPTKFKKGDKVVITGRLYANAAGTVQGRYVTNVTTYITRVAEGTKKPYNTTGDLGWMSEDSIKLYDQPINNKIINGDYVVPITLRSYNGTKLVQYDAKYIVSNINGDKCLLSAERGNKVIPWASMNINNIRKV